MEATVIARLIDRPGLQASVEVGYASRENKLVELGAGVQPFTITAINIDLATVMDDDAVVMPGYPLFSRWAGRSWAMPTRTATGSSRRTR